MTQFPPMQQFSEGVEATIAMPREVEMLAKALSLIHGRVVARKEKDGLQLYMACPECLMKDGKKALNDRKLAVNADRVFGTGKYALHVGQYQADFSGFCMKQSKGFNISDLRVMAPLRDRGFPDAPSGVTKPSTGRCLIADGKGNMIPDHPGDVVSMIELPADHPAVMYLTNRRFDLARLHRQFRISFCTREAPENSAMDRYYRKLPCGFRDTPQNRIIFYADVHGVQRGWQARIIDHVGADGLKYYLHTYSNQWAPMEQKNHVTGKWEPMAHVLQEHVGWNPGTASVHNVDAKIQSSPASHGAIAPAAGTRRTSPSYQHKRLR